MKVFFSTLVCLVLVGCGGGSGAPVPPKNPDPPPGGAALQTSSPADGSSREAIAP